MTRQAILALLLFPTLTHAQGAPAASSAAAEAKPAVLKEYFVYAGSEGYPKELADKGVQGTTTVQAALADDGSLSNPVLVESSRSDELDRSAASIVSDLKLKLNPAGKKPTEVQIPVLFVKDSVSILPNKSCAEFNIDREYFTRTFPEKDIGDMIVFDMATGIIYSSALSNPMELIKKLKSAPSSTASTCSASPKLKFLDVYLKAAR